MMNRHKLIPVLAGMLLILFFSSCKEKNNVIYEGMAEPADFSLSFSTPEIFDFEISEESTGKCDFAIELTYYPDQMQGWDELPLYYILQRPEKEEEMKFRLKIKDEKGWRGELMENETDRKFEEVIMSGVELGKGKHQFRLYGNSPKEGKPILGIVRVVFKIYKK